MGLFDNYNFSGDQSNPLQGLLSLISTQSAFNPQSSGLPAVDSSQAMAGSPFDPATYAPSGPPPGGTGFYGQTTNVPVGNYLMPQFGTAPQPTATDNAQLPTNAQPTQYVTPPSQDMGIGDRFLSALTGFGEGGREGGLIGALTGGINGFSNGVTTRNQTAQALIAHGLDPALAQTVVKTPSLLKAVLPQILGTSGQTSDIKDYEYAKRQGFKGTFQDWIASKRSGAGEYGMTPIYGTGPDGKPGIMQLGKNGTPQMVPLPNGFQIARDPIKVDGPTGTTILDPQTRQPISFIPKDLKGAEIQKAEGESQGKARVELPGAITDAEQTIKKIDGLINSPGLSSIVGPLDQYRGSWTLGEQGRDALARYNQLKGTAFLQVYGQLRGGGAITEVEGKKAEDAIARMDRAQSEEDFKKALEEFKEVIKIGVDRMRTRAGLPAGLPVAPTQPAPNIDNLLKKYGS